MMRFRSHSLEPRTQTSTFEYQSTVTLQSESSPAVRYTIARLSFARRMELARRVLELARTAAFHEAGKKPDDAIQAHILACEIDRIYLRWGLVEITGLTIDGEAATADLIAEKGPEAIAREIVQAIKAQCGLTEDERKN